MKINNSHNSWVSDDLRLSSRNLKTPCILNKLYCEFTTMYNRAKAEQRSLGHSTKASFISMKFLNLVTKTKLHGM